MVKKSEFVNFNKAFNTVSTPFGVKSGRTSYLGNGYWQKADLSQNSALENVNSFQVGAGNNAVKIDSQGQWFGGNKFKDGKVKISPDQGFVFNDGRTNRILIGTI